MSTNDHKSKLRDFIADDHRYFLVPIQGGLNDNRRGIEADPYHCHGANLVLTV